MMDKRSICLLIICVNLFLVIWLVIVPQPLMLETEAPPVASAFYAAPASAISSASSFSNNNKPNQIHEPSRYNFSYNHSLVSLDKAATPAPLATPSPPAPTSTSTQHTTKSSQLIDLNNFAYVMNQRACSADIKALILVHTAPRNVEKRSIIRQTWGGPIIEKSPVRVVFLLGALPPEEQSVQWDLTQENNLYGDMVQGNFQDAYRNMTYKHVMALKWFHNNCPQAKLLIKVDDDVYVHTPQLLKYLTEPTAATSTTAATLIQSSTTPTASSLRSLLGQQHDLLFCRPLVGSRVKRSYRSKWRVSFSEYSEHYYPPYCPGFAIIYSPDVVFRLYKAAQRSNYFWIDDVHITGIMAQETNTTITSVQPYILDYWDYDLLLSGQTDLMNQEFLFTSHSIGPERINALWQLILMQNSTRSKMEAS
ncbi:uncharacterized protein Dwil_GK16591 [Drosophila willistoni]|uniref:Hexosyltransferase n=1 Tax=Drosophila willistoni TaxID=7260 RepID=B4MMZ2_DROWI|nr:uncharacterized protein Dwil_GK16591 [Drosophila willistoni]